MFGISKASPGSQAFISNILSTNQSRSLALSLALAKTLSDGIVVPGSQVTSSADYYRLQCKTAVDQCLNSINELMPLDVPTVQSYVLKFYQLRCQALCLNNKVIAFNPETAIVDFFGISRAIDPEALGVIATQSANISTMYLKFTTLLAETGGVKCH